MKQTLEINNPLIERCKQGDIKAQFLLYKQYSTSMYNIAIRFLNNKMDAEDILQESFITAFNKLVDLKSDASFGTWLKRIVINNCISFLRKNKIYFEDVDDFPAEEMAASQEIEKSASPALIHNAIKELPEGARTVLVLHSLEGYKHREISEMLSISESTCRTQYKRALGLLNSKLKNKIYVN
ncbi:MAG: RNA polymerase sigma factor [Bacteroidales bacterium]|nr:RNA polymerase sigma factor [Bacteroidales bacterium]